MNPASVADAAVAALVAEAALYPKPGLVSPVDSGSHSDMDFPLLSASAHALRPDFEAMAAAGSVGAGFRERLVPLGVAAEARMMEVTGGVNTHRGAIFALGLLAAAAGAAGGVSGLREVLQSAWGDELARHDGLRKDHAAGARREAAMGFPTIFDVARPAFLELLCRVPPREAAVETFFLLLSRVHDTNLLRRGGTEGAAFARAAASDFLQNGGVASPDWETRAVAIHHAFVGRNLSPGGAADLLAAVFFLHALEHGPGAVSAWSP